MGGGGVDLSIDVESLHVVLEGLSGVVALLRRVNGVRVLLQAVEVGDLRLPGVCDILDKQLNKIAKNCMEERSAWNLLGHSLLLNVSKTQRFRWVESLERQVGDAAETRLGGGGTVCVMTEQLFPC